MAAGPTTRTVVDATGAEVVMLGGQDSGGNFVLGRVAFDVNGAPISAALDSSVQAATAAVVAQTGVQGAGSTFNPPAGGSGALGFLSGILKAITGTLSVSGTFWPATQPVSATALPLPAGAALETGGNLTAILTKLGAVVLATGGNVIGAVTQSGSWVLSAGSALIGKVGIDQTTPGTTNKVSLGSDIVNTAPANSGPGTNASVSPPAVGNVIATVTVAVPGAYYAQNQSAAQLGVVFDDGAGGNVSTLLLDPSPLGAGFQGGDTGSPMAFFTGRIRITGPNGSQCMIRYK